jgi:isocitrate dehydrogenase
MYHRKEDLKRPLRCVHRQKAEEMGWRISGSSRSACLAGDGIGPEITDATVEVLHAASERTGLKLRLTHCLVGWKAREQEGTLHAARI